MHSVNNFLQQDERWSIYENIKDYSSFCQKILPEIYLKPEVHSDIRSEFRVIEKLLQHSYYEYEFYDVAAQKSMFALEMALKIKFREIHNESFKGALGGLINWFAGNNFFETTNKEYLDYIRSVRNNFAHPERYSFGGSMMSQWISHPLDLINDLYESRKLRKQRTVLYRSLNIRLKSIVENGAVISGDGTKQVIFSADTCFINNKTSPSEIALLFFPLFETNEAKFERGGFKSIPIIHITCNSTDIKEKGNYITIKDNRSRVLYSCKPITDQNEQVAYNNWLAQLRSLKTYLIVMNWVNINTNNYYTNLMREFYKI